MGIGSIAAPHALGVGLVVGGVAAATSLQPTFSKRSATQQALITGGAVLGGVGVGALLGAGAGKLSRHVPGGPLAVFSALAVGGVAAKVWSEAGDGVPGPIVGAAGSTGTLAATVGGAGLAVLGGRSLGAGLARALPGAMAGGRLAGAMQTVAGPLVLTAGVGGLALAMHNSDPSPAHPPSRVVAQAAAAADAVKDRPVSGTPSELLPTVGGAGPAARGTARVEDLGKHGRRFLHETVPGERIREVMGEGIDPIRVYAGLQAGATPQERVDAAMSTAERLGAFDGSREKIVIATPTGSGFVDPPSVQAAEYMARGRVASIAIQYANKPSIQSTGEVPVGAETTRLLATAIQERISRMPEDQRPEVLLFGESLGAWAQQEIFEGRGVGSLDELGIDRSLWVGSPHESGFPDEAVAEGQRSLREFDRIEEIDALPQSERDDLRHVLLTHRNDPVSVVNKATLGFQRPEWLPAHGQHPEGVPASMRYVPGVSLLQGVVDLVNGTKPVPGSFLAHAHDYRADLPEFVRTAYGHADPAEPDHVTEQQVARITQELVHAEKVRAATIAENPGW